MTPIFLHGILGNDKHVFHKNRMKRNRSYTLLPLLNYYYEVDYIEPRTCTRTHTPNTFAFKGADHP